MQESLVKLVVVLTALVSLVIGGMFLVIPGWFVVVSSATVADVGWLRSVGASVVGLQGFGLLIAAFRRRDTNPLMGMVAFVTTVQSGALWYSLFSAEYGETSRWAIIVPGVLATIAAVLLWLAWASRRRSIAGLPQKRTKNIPAPSHSAPEPAEPPADLIEEIDAESPRFKE